MNIFGIIACILLCLGTFFFISEIIGLFRFKHTVNRMHAAALGDTLGLLFCVAGIILLRGFSFTAFKLALIPVFVFFTSPVASHLIAKTEVAYHGNAHQEYREEFRSETSRESGRDAESEFCESGQEAGIESQENTLEAKTESRENGQAAPRKEESR